MKDRLIEPDDVFQYRKGELTVEGVSLSKIADHFGSPTYVYSASAIRESYSRLKGAMRGLPVQICYAVKANSNLKILEIFKKLGAGCDLVSFGEWYRAELVKFPRQLRVLSGVAKTADEFDRLFEFENAAVGSIHVESVMEFELIHTLAHYRQRPVTVAFRYNPDVDAKTHDKISTGRRKDKFGLTREEILDLCVNFSHDDFVHIAGLSIHIGSQITQTQPYEQAFRELQKLCIEVEDHLGRELEYVDLGGGIGVPYSFGAKSISLKCYADLIKRYFYSKNYKKNKILLEPGRSLIANAGALITEVVYSKMRPNHRTLILDSGMNDLMRPALYDAFHEIVPLKKEKFPVKKWDVVGGICETTDYFARDRKLSVEGNPGERLAILSAGAYGFSMSNTYNTRPLVAEVMVDGGKPRVIRKRQSLVELLSSEVE